jgi:hypothetical protein
MPMSFFGSRSDVFLPGLKVEGRLDIFDLITEGHFVFLLVFEDWSHLYIVPESVLLASFHWLIHRFDF